MNVNAVLAVVDHILTEIVKMDDAHNEHQNANEIVTYCELARQGARDVQTRGNREDVWAAYGNAEHAAAAFWGMCTQEYLDVCALLEVTPKTFADFAILDFPHGWSDENGFHEFD